MRLAEASSAAARASESACARAAALMAAWVVQGCFLSSYVSGAVQILPQLLPSCSDLNAS